MRKRLAAFGLFLIALLIFPASVPALDLTEAPLNPVFLKHRDAVGAGRAADASVDAAPIVRTGRGLVPSPVDLSHLKRLPARVSADGTAADRSEDAFPAQYDLRGLGLVSPVRDQGEYGTCWTFSALASLESSLRRRTSRAYDLSEWFLAYFGYIDQRPGYPGFGNYDESSLPWAMSFGGDDMRAAAVLTRWTGAVRESDVPYAGPYPRGDEPVVVSPLDVVFLRVDPDSYYPALNAADAKRALMRYGAVSVGMFAEFSEVLGFYNPAAHAFYIPADNPYGLGVGSADHAVTIVGWDDDYPAANFAVAPPADGAWIVRNSWGDAWGDGGYFYMSYYDAVLDSGFAFIGLPAEAPGAYVRLYQHDPLGWTNSYKVNDSGTAWMANVFTAAEDEYLGAVGFYAPGRNNAYEISIRTGVDADPASGVPACGPQAGMLSDPGYHTVRLDDRPLVRKGEKFAVVVRLTTPGYEYPLVLETRVMGYSDKASAGAGESFISEDGATWQDLTDVAADANVCLKAYAVDRSGGSSVGGCFIDALH